MSNSNEPKPDQENDMLPEDAFSQGVRSKHSCRNGRVYTVNVTLADVTLAYEHLVNSSKFGALKLGAA